jgi:hypothetical protein
MNIAKKLNGIKSALELTAGEGISILSNAIHIDDAVVTTDTQLSTLAGTLVTQSALATAIDTLVTEDFATSTLASKLDSNVFEGVNIFEQNALFRRRILLTSDGDVSREVPGAGGAIYAFRELEALRSHFTAPTWVTVTLDPANFRDDGYWPEGPQYTRIQYGDSYKVQLRGELREKDDYLNATDTRVLFTLPVGYRPPRRQVFSCGGGSGGVSASILVNVDGNVLFLAQSSIVEPDESVTSLYLCPISFFTN